MSADAKKQLLAYGPATLVKVFCQVDTIRGYRFIDLAGRVMNQYDSHFTDMAVAVDGLRMMGGTDAWDEARASARQIWAGFSFPPTFDFVRETAASYVREVASLFEVTSAGRMACRAQFVIGIEGIDGKTRLAGNVIKLPTVAAKTPIEAFNSNIRFRYGDYMVSISTPSVTRADGPDAPIDLASQIPSEGVMIDVDFYVEGKALPILNYPHTLRNAGSFFAEQVPSLADHLLVDQQ